jgi:hypothetical protein
MIVLEEPEMDRPLNLLPCALCKQPRVLKKGDYCNACATKWDRIYEEYFIVTDTETVADVSEISGIAPEYLKAKMENAAERHCVYVIFYGKGAWNEIVISDRFHVPFIMESILSKEQE